MFQMSSANAHLVKLVGAKRRKTPRFATVQRSVGHRDSIAETITSHSDCATPSPPLDSSHRQTLADSVRDSLLSRNSVDRTGCISKSQNNHLIIFFYSTTHTHIRYGPKIEFLEVFWLGEDQFRLLRLGLVSVSFCLGTLWCRRYVLFGPGVLSLPFNLGNSERIGPGGQWSSPLRVALSPVSLPQQLVVTCEWGRVENCYSRVSPEGRAKRQVSLSVTDSTRDAVETGVVGDDKRHSHVRCALQRQLCHWEVLIGSRIGLGQFAVLYQLGERDCRYASTTDPGRQLRFQLKLHITTDDRSIHAVSSEKVLFDSAPLPSLLLDCSWPSSMTAETFLPTPSLTVHLFSG